MPSPTNQYAISALDYVIKHKMTTKIPCDSIAEVERLVVAMNRCKRKRIEEDIQWQPFSDYHNIVIRRDKKNIAITLEYNSFFDKAMYDVDGNYLGKIGELAEEGEEQKPPADDIDLSDL